MGIGLQFTVREGPRVWGFEWHNGIRVTYNCTEATRLRFGEGYTLRNHATGIYLTSRIISPRGKVRFFVEGMAGPRQFFTTKKYYNAQLIEPVKEVPHHQFTFAAGLGGGFRIRVGTRTSIECQYTRWRGTPTRFIDAQNARLVGGQVKFPLKEATDTRMDTYQVGIVFEMGKLDKAERKIKKRSNPKTMNPEVPIPDPGTENPDPAEKG
jgi:hypothetical protein